MLGLSVQIPSVRRFHEDPVTRAVEAAGTVSGGYTGPPCAFVRLGEGAEQLLRALRPAGSGAGGWVLVTVRVSGEDAHRVHLHERSLTAAQRFMLALACDGVDSQWIAAVPDAEAFEAVGVTLGGHVPVGLVWCRVD